MVKKYQKRLEAATRLWKGLVALCEIDKSIRLYHADIGFFLPEDVGFDDEGIYITVIGLHDVRHWQFDYYSYDLTIKQYKEEFLKAITVYRKVEIYS